MMKPMKFNKHVQVRKEKFGTVIFETLKEKVYVTNQTGSDIVDLLKGGKDENTIIRELAAKYRTDSAAIAQDIKDFINDMTSREVLV